MSDDNKKNKGSSTGGILPILLMISLIFATSLFSTDHPLDAFFMTIALLVTYALALFFIGGLILLFIYFVGITLKDLYGSLKDEFEADDWEHMHAIGKDMKKRILKALAPILPAPLKRNLKNKNKRQREEQYKNDQEQGFLKSWEE